MGRKIPGRKHRGIRDPEKQQIERWNSIKEKVNAPPQNPDDQQIPKSLIRYMDLKNRTKAGAFTKKPKDTSVETTKIRTQSSEKTIPKFEQRKGESDKSFLYRVNKICKSVIQEVDFEIKYGVDIKRHPDTGEVKDVVKRPKDELEMLLKKIRKGKKKKNLKETTENQKLTKSQKWHLKKMAKKQKKRKLLNIDSQENRDYVEFGDIVHAPPSLSAPAKASKLLSRPGEKQLLLKSILDKKGQTKKTEHKVINKKGKRKDLPAALRRQLDKQQSDIIEAYKLLKKRNC